jgi:hypothetical protein
MPFENECFWSAATVLPHFVFAVLPGRIHDKISQILPPVGHLKSALAGGLVSVDSKKLIDDLNRLDATLANNPGEGAYYG